MNIDSKLASADVGDDSEELAGSQLAIAGITLRNKESYNSAHYNTIECYARTLSEAQALRDEVLNRILAYKEN